MCGISKDVAISVEVENVLIFIPGDFEFRMVKNCEKTEFFRRTIFPNHLLPID